MATSKEFLNYVLEQLSPLKNVTSRPMMGEYLLYYNGKLIGGIYDDRFLIKPVKSAVEYIKEAVFDIPYKGAKEMLLVDNLDDKDYLKGLIETMYDDLPLPKQKR